MQAIVAAQGQRGLRGADFLQRGLVVQVFFAVPLEGGNPPGGCRARQRELGQLGVDLRLLHAGLLREFVAEADAVVVDAEHHVKAALVVAAGAGLLGEAGAQFVVMVAGQAALAPGLLPGFIEAALRLPGKRDIALQAAVAKQHAQPRRCDHCLAIAFHPVRGAAFMLGFDDHHELLVG